ncbi:MAG: aromatic ring-hydroxylating dioxygenase subunit alpha [Cocleimonas sp.]
MAARNYKQWSAKPDLELGEWVDSRIYSDEEIFEEEQEKIFKKTWIPICHESELPELYDFRTANIAREPIIIVRGPDNKIRSFLNVCPHRGMAIERRAAGSFAPAQPSGNPKHMTCMFHAWQFDMKGNCVDIPRQKEGYQDRLDKSKQGLRQLRCETKYGGFVWVCLDDQMPQTVEQWMGGAMDCIKDSLDEEPLEIIHYHKAIIDCNYKLWHDTNSEFYHDYMHYHNRVTGFDDGYFARECSGFPNGHVNVGTFEVNYDDYELGADDGDRGDLTFPHLPPNNWYMVDMFPGMNLNLRGSALRMDLMTPLSANQVMIEFKGFGLKSDTEEERAQRIHHHNSIWGPLGRNLHEDLIGISGQGVTMKPKSDIRRIQHARHEGSYIHDEIGLRHFYENWGKWMDRLPSNPTEKYRPGKVKGPDMPPAKGMKLG